MTNKRAARNSGSRNPRTERRPRARLAALMLSVALAIGAPLVGATAANAADAATTATAATAANATPPTQPTPSGPTVRWSVSPATPSALDTTRTFYDYEAARGVTLDDHVAVTNFSAQPITFHVYAADATTNYTTATYTLVSGKTRSKDLGTWVSIQGKADSCPATDTGSKLTDCLAGIGATVTVQPQTAVIIPFQIDIPKNASAGDHSAGIVAAYTVKGSGKTSVAVERRVGARVYLRVAGKLTPELTASGTEIGFKGSANPFAGGTSTVGFDLTDSGNTRVTADTEFKVTGPFGIPIATVKGNRVQDIIPGGVAHVHAKVAGSVPRLFLLFGGITVTSEHADGNARADTLPAVVHATAVTLAVPWVWVAIVLIVAAAVVGGFWRRRRQREALAVALHQYALQVQEEAAARELVAQGGDRERGN